ncbi:MAG: ABC transporter ATP-binding protein [Lachnospiraceae bacterium]|nr:ABC transporter ATP-binding protein [Lachnospiraceae bacterium]
MSETLLEVKDLQVDFLIGKKTMTAVHDISFQIEKGRTLAIVGESGCGKSVTATSIMRLLPRETSRIANGEILLEGTDLVKMSEKEIRKIRGNRIAMIFQDPMTALNPVYTIGKQMIEMCRVHNKISKAEAYKKCVQMLEIVGIPLPEQRMNEYPYQMSGGMRQRIMIAMALSCDAQLLIADEPTTALDVTIQAQVLDQMRKVKKEFHTAILLITHDMGVVAEMADDVLVMYAGEIVEYGTVEDIFEHPTHPYTTGLLKSIPRLDSDDREELFTIDGVVPALSEFGVGCRFANRCHCVSENCKTAGIEYQNLGGKHICRCNLPVD